MQPIESDVEHFKSASAKKKKETKQQNTSYMQKLINTGITCTRVTGT